MCAQVLWLWLFAVVVGRVGRFTYFLVKASKDTPTLYCGTCGVFTSSQLSEIQQHYTGCEPGGQDTAAE